MKLITGTLLIATLVLAPVEVEFAWAKTERPAQLPWTTFSGEMIQAFHGTPMFAPCPEGQAVVMRFTYKDAEYVMLASQESPVIAFAYDANPTDIDAPYTEVGIGHMDPATPDVIPPLVWEPYAEKHKNACQLLFPEQA